MAYREVSVIEIREVLRLWVGGEGLRGVERLTTVDRKTVRRYVNAAVELGLERDGGVDQITDVLVAGVVEAVRPHRPGGHGAAWEACEANREVLVKWLQVQHLSVVKAHQLLERQGVVVPQRTLYRFAAQELGVGRPEITVRVADCEPGAELQVDFGRMGLIADPGSGRRRVCQALVFTPVFSRYSFVWLTFSQTLASVIEGFEAAWVFFGGVFAVVIPDNMASIVSAADSVAPKLSDAFVEYSQSRGFVVDPARVRSPQDKPRVERVVPYVRNNFFAGEDFVDLPDAQRRVEVWCRTTAGLRVHGTTQVRPAEAFAAEEAPALSPAPSGRYDLPHWGWAKVARDHHVQVLRSLYSVPGHLIGTRVQVRADSVLVKILHRGEVIKIHPRQRPGGRVTDADDLPAERTVYAMRDLDKLAAMATRHGPSVGVYAKAVLDTPLPWTKMRQVYRLLGLVKRFGPDRVDEACRRALEVETVDVGLISRMLERATESAEADPTPAPTVIVGRFARDPDHFAVNTSKGPHPHPNAAPRGASGGATAPQLFDDGPETDRGGSR